MSADNPSHMSASWHDDAVQKREESIPSLERTSTGMAIAVWLKDMWNWLKEARLLWLLVAVVGVALVLAFGGEASEAKVRVTGWILELIGLGTVAWNIFETQRTFAQPDLLTLARTWLARFPRYSRSVGIRSAGITRAIGTAEERDTALPIRIIHHASLESRVATLERQIRNTDTRLDEMQHELSVASQGHEAALNQERQRREEQHREIKRALEVAETSSLHLSAVGLVWLALGLTLSTIPNELLSLLR